MGRYAVMLVLALSFSLMLYGYGLRTTFFAAETEAMRNYGTNQARNIAQSAAMIAVQKILDEDDDDLNPETDEVIRIPIVQTAFAAWPAMQGEYRYDITNQADTLIFIATQGRFQGSTYTVEVTMAMAGDEWDFQARRAVFAGTNISLSGSARVNGHVATNATAAGSVNLAWSIRIDSSLAIGPGGNPLITVINPRPLNANIGDGVSTLPREETYPLPDFPVFPVPESVAPAITVSGAASPTYSYTYFENKFVPEIRIQSNTTMRIDVGSEDRVIHVGHLNISQGHLDIIGSGKLTIYVDNNITLNGSSTLNRHGGPEKVFTYYKGTTQLDFAGATTFRGGIFAETANIRIGGSGGIQGNIITGGSSVQIYGNAEANSRIIYAPNAHVTLTGSGRARGAIVSNRFTASGSTYVVFTSNFDDELPRLRGGSSSEMRVRSWR